jgi:hypothetical protein
MKRKKPLMNRKMGLCWSKDQPLLVTSGSSLQTSSNTTEASKKTISEHQNPFAGTEPEPLQI